MSNTRLQSQLISILMILAVAALTVNPAAAAPQRIVCSSAVTVTNNHDTGAGSLRQAMGVLCPGGTITFDNNYSIALSTGELAIAEDMTIDGGLNNITISGGGVTRVFDVSAGTVVFNHLTIANGSPSTTDCGSLVFSCGGGLILQDNSAIVVTITNSTFSGNSAVNCGAAIYQQTGTLNVTNTSFSANTATGSFSTGGAIFASSGTTNVTGSSFSGNSAYTAGGIEVAYGTLNVSGSTFSANSASNAGGGIAVYTDGTANVSNSTFSGNSAFDGGGIYAQGILNVTNSSLVGNTASDSVGGILNNGSGPVTVKNTLIVKGAAGANCIGILGGATNLADDATCGAGFTNSASIKPGTLGNYGGSTQTIPLLAGSSAINTGDNTVCAAAPVSNLDQRGVARPQDTTCDIGAYEVDIAGVNVYDAGSLISSLNLPEFSYVRKYYSALNNGPVQITSSNGMNILSSIKVNYNSVSYSEMLGLPTSLLAKEYWFPVYNSTGLLASQLRVGNIDGASTTISVYVGNGSLLDSFSLAGNSTARRNYTTTNDGPLRVVSSTATIMTSVRYLYNTNSYSEELGMPVGSLTDDYWFPWYNNTAFSSELRVANVGSSTASVSVYIGSGTLLDSYTLAAGANHRASYTGANNGPLHVVSSGANVLPSIMVMYSGNSYSEMLGLPASRLTNDYWLPYYDNVNLSSQVRVGNMGGSSTTISVYAGSGGLLESYSLAAGSTSRRTYAGVTDGPLHIISSADNVMVSVRELYTTPGFNSYYELLAAPGNALTSKFWFPWYNNTAFSSELRMAAP